MKLLLDECLPRKFKQQLLGHSCRTVPEEGLAGRKNGELLALAQQAGIEVLLTIDQGIEYEQNLQQLGSAVILIRARSSRLADFLPHVPEILVALLSIHAGQVVHVP